MGSQVRALLRPLIKKKSDDGFFFFLLLSGKKEESLYHSQPDEGGMIHEKYCADPAANTAITNVDQEREIL